MKRGKVRSIKDGKNADLLSRGNKILEGTIQDLVMYGEKIDYNRSPVEHWIDLWRNDPSFRKFIFDNDGTKEVNIETKTKPIRPLINVSKIRPII